MQFDEMIIWEGHVFLLRFTLVHTGLGMKFFIVAQEKNGELAHCEMKKDAYDKWKLMPPVPGQLLNLEQLLVNLIEKKLAENGSP